MSIEKIIEFCKEKIQSSIEEIEEIKKDGHRSSYAHGYEVGCISTMNELLDFIKEQAE